MASEGVARSHAGFIPKLTLHFIVTIRGGGGVYGVTFTIFNMAHCSTYTNTINFFSLPGAIN